LEILDQNSPLRLGDRIGLKSGLLEITYDTGAVVILQGPVRYEVESPVGGYLSLGKLTARLGKKSEVRGQKSEVGGLRSESDNQQFAIRTPTALVTDLGTEFGVEVDRQGVTKSHVFRGLVRVQAIAPEGKVKDDGRLLHENESARVERGGKGSILVMPVTGAAEFIRRVPKPSMTSLDLVDIVAGGDGFSRNRNRGIDPTTGRTADKQPIPRGLKGDHQYHRVPSSPLVDGVFVPDGSLGAVQIDSLGHTFDGFDKTDNSTCGHIWAGGPVVFSDATDDAIRTELGGVDYGATGHGVLAMHANKGITFDLAAIRRATPDGKLVRFRAITGNTEVDSQNGRNVYADVCVLVDGQIRFRRRQINSYQGAMPVVIPLGEGDRFLTLTATDGGNGSACDCIIFGDPVLDIATKSEGTP
jgi:hypothetical protein